MKITNIHGLSQCWVTAAENDSYDKVGWRSCTTLIGPPRIAILMDRHADKLEEDVSECIWKLLGSAMHAILELAADTSSISEQRFIIDVDGKEISFKPDRIEMTPDTEPLQYHQKDFKVTSVWKMILGGTDDWDAQLNINSYGLKLLGFNVTRHSNEILFRDWRAGDAEKHGHDYPQHKVVVRPGEMWSDEKAEAFLKGRIKLFEDAEKLPDNQLPFCTMEERWAREDKFAVMKVGGKRATRVLSTEQAARNYMAEHPIKKGVAYGPIDHRKGMNIRCESYCPVKKFCNQYNNILNPSF